MKLSDKRKDKVVQFIKVRDDGTLLLSPEVISDGLEQISIGFTEVYETVYVDVTYKFMNRRYVYTAIANQEDIYKVSRLI